jgi:hypothetical protein
MGKLGAGHSLRQNRQQEFDFTQYIFGVRFLRTILGAIWQGIPSRILGSPLHQRCSVRWIRRGPLQRQDLRSIQALPSAASATAHRVIIQPSSPNASAFIRACAWPGYRKDNGLRADIGPQRPVAERASELVNYPRIQNRLKCLLCAVSTMSRRPQRHRFKQSDWRRGLSLRFFSYRNHLFQARQDHLAHRAHG